MLRVLLLMLLLLLVLLCQEFPPPFAHTTHVFVCVLISTYGYLWIHRGYFGVILVLFWYYFGVILVLF